ncbi:unnamed protein product [Cylicocyclus nassatus]|uniref:Uncharacterized protein n=1 Tax=Cylicocyclus nassatus TaxID=53992 RepID=A0AA36GP81_CYLNA|nr:unnamed protein product [Cylicocyclus nassatus]
MCTIFQSGEVNQAGRGKLFELHRQLVLPTCKRPLPLAPNVEFQQLPEPTVAQSESRKAQLLAMNTTASLTIIDWVYLSGSVFYLKNTKIPDAAGHIRRPRGRRQRKKQIGMFLNFNEMDEFTVLLKSQQTMMLSTIGEYLHDLCQRRLYFGDVYNVTGYTFLNAYAFTDRCACAGICCGQVPIHESIEHGLYYYSYNEALDNQKTEVNQTLYIAGILNADNTTWHGMSKSGC